MYLSLYFSAVVVERDTSTMAAGPSLGTYSNDTEPILHGFTIPERVRIVPICVRVPSAEMAFTVSGVEELLYWNVAVVPTSVKGTPVISTFAAVWLAL